MKKISLVTSILCLCVLSLANENNLEEQALSKMQTLQETIKKAESKKINTLKENIALRTAEVFLKYASWDAENTEINKELFAKVPIFKNDASKFAEDLPDYQRSEIVKMLDDANEQLESVLNKKSIRLDSPNVDWAKVKIDKSQILLNGKPVFLADWTWKPDIEEYNQYFGNEDGFYIPSNNLLNEDGDFNKRILETLKNKPSGKFGSMGLVMGVPAWAKEKYPDLEEKVNGRFITFDINHPAAREIWKNMCKNVVPLAKGKNYSNLGYSLANEPHWNIIGSWAAAPISDYAVEEFKKWLEKKHKNIKTLNKLWGTTFKSFKTMNPPNSVDSSEIGTAKYFDLLSFNMDRVTEWFKFQSDEIKKYDKNAKTQIKLIPNFWSKNSKDSGIDVEALTFNSDIIGNDVGSGKKWMYGKPHKWETHYSFDWIELAMDQDFMKSVAPDKIMYNSEGHFLSTVHFRDLYLTKEYVRLNYWQSVIHGLNVVQTWYWTRKPDGSIGNKNEWYAGSNNHQPRVVNEVHATIADLNSVSDEISAFQSQERPVRIFYTKASAINKSTHMDDIFDMYQDLYFEGISLGFATENILKTQNLKSSIIIVAKTPYVFKEDFQALQKFISAGGTVIIDQESIKTDEYNRPTTIELSSQGKGRLITVETAKDATNKALSLIKDSSYAPKLIVDEDNGSSQKTCTWRVIETKSGSKILNIANYGKNEAQIEIKNRDGSKIKSVRDVLTGKKEKTKFTMPVYGLKFLEIK